MLAEVKVEAEKANARMQVFPAPLALAREPTSSRPRYTPRLCYSPPPPELPRAPARAPASWSRSPTGA